MSWRGIRCKRPNRTLPPKYPQLDSENVAKSPGAPPNWNWAAMVWGVARQHENGKEANPNEKIVDLNPLD